MGLGRTSARAHSPARNRHGLTARTDGQLLREVVESRRKVLLPLVASGAYLAVLTWSYSVVVPNAHYNPLTPGSLVHSAIAPAAMMLTLVVLTAPLAWSRVSTLIVWLLILLAFVPQLAIFLVHAESAAFMWATTGFWVIVSAIIQLVPRIPLPRVAPFAGGGGVRVAILIYGLLAVLGIGTLVAYSGWSVIGSFLHTGWDFGGAYDNRATFVAARVPLNGYYLHWAALAFNPLFFVLAIQRRLWLIVVAIAVFEVAIASFVGMRSYFFAIPFACAAAAVAGRRSMPLLIAGGMTVLVLGGVAAYLAGRGTYPYLFFTARLLLDAGQLNFSYYDVFQNAPIPFAYAIKYFLHLPYPFHYPYHESPDVVVAIKTLHTHEAAVGGIVADGFMNLGYAGMVLWAATLGMICKLLDAVAERVPPSIAGASVAMAIVSISGTYLVRVLATEGLFWTIIVLFLVSASAEPRAQQESEPGAARPQLPVAAAPGRT
jgi:hypothetical protein